MRNLLVNLVSVRDTMKMLRLLSLKIVKYAYIASCKMRHHWGAGRSRGMFHIFEQTYLTVILDISMS